MTGAVRLAVGLAVAGLVLAGCAGPGSAGAGGDDAVTLNVAAAASLRDAVSAITEAYAAAHPSVSFTVTTDSSAALRTQIEQGAPVDVFLSADRKNPQALVDGGLSAGNPVPFAANSLSLVVPAGNPARIASPADLAMPGLRLIAAGDEVPITAYADRVMANLAVTQADPAAWTAAVQANVASREDNVAAVLARIELDEGDAAFVYATDAARSDGVTVVEIPAAANVSTELAGVVPTTATHPDTAAAFLAWVAGPAGQAELRPLGFRAP